MAAYTTLYSLKESYAPVWQLFSFFVCFVEDCKKKSRKAIRILSTHSHSQLASGSLSALPVRVYRSLANRLSLAATVGWLVEGFSNVALSFPYSLFCHLICCWVASCLLGLAADLFTFVFIYGRRGFGLAWLTALVLQSNERSWREEREGRQIYNSCCSFVARLMSCSRAIKSLQDVASDSVLPLTSPRTANALCEIINSFAWGGILFRLRVPARDTER